jgi:hypothetical protein
MALWRIPHARVRVTIIFELRGWILERVKGGVYQALGQV